MLKTHFCHSLTHYTVLLRYERILKFLTEVEFDFTRPTITDRAMQVFVKI